jgi:gamma-D-glutamyl-L-lysine dipeptidyl-peptidase
MTQYQGGAAIGVSVTNVWSEPSAVRPIDELIVCDEPNIARWVSLQGPGERLDLLDRLSTQALCGEPVVVIREFDGWSEVRLPWQRTPKDPIGYPGYIKSAHIISVEPSASETVGERLGTLTRRLTPVLKEPQGAIADFLSMGTVGAVTGETGGHVRIEVGGSLWWVSRADIAVGRAPAPQYSSAADPRLMPVATSLVGLPYLWAGMSGWGVDCSGLVHLSNRVLGHLVSRDSTAMRMEHLAAGEAPTPGEQLFFRRRTGDRQIHHVGLAVDTRTLLHAPRTGQVVELMPLSESPYSEELERALP